MNVQKKIKYSKVDICDNDYILKIQVAIDFLNEIKKDISLESKELDSKISICDLKTSEILNYIEVYPKFNVVNGYKILKYLSNIRLERRVYKEQKKILESIKSNKFDCNIGVKNYVFEWKYVNPNDIKKSNDFILEIEDPINYLYRIKDDLKTEYKKIDSILSRCILKKSEILHYIEAYTNFNVVDGYKILKYLKNIIIEYNIRTNQKRIIDVIKNNKTENVITKKTSNFKLDKVDITEILKNNNR